MEIKLSVIGEVPVFHLSGRLDVTTSPLLEDRLLPLLSTPGQKILFDCSSLVYVSSAGLRVFISTLRALSSTQGKLAFCSLTPPVQELFQLAGLENLFLIEETPDQAIARLA